MKVAPAVLLVLILSLVGCGGDDGDEAVAASSCGRVLYEGDGRPDVVIVSDLPLRGVGAQSSRAMIDAIERVLRAHGFRAGKHRVGYQSCNDTVGDEPFDPLLCRSNAQAYVATSAVVAVIGPWNSGCAFEQIPIVSRKAAGPLAMVSPSNTWAGLTRRLPGDPKSGDALYPDGVRSYARVVTHDLSQGIAVAHLAARLGARKVAVLQPDNDAYARGIALPFTRAAEGLGIQVHRFTWPVQKSYARVARDVARARPDAVFLAGITQLNAKQLVQDLRAALGADVPLIGPDSFAASGIARKLGQAGEGMFITEGGIRATALPPAGQRRLRALGLRPEEVEGTWAPEAAQAAEVLLDAIGRSDGTRASVVDAVFATSVKGGILGSFTFDRFGDVVPAPVSVYRVRNGKLVRTDVVRVPLDVVGK